MANWASASYAIEGPEEILHKIEYALNNPTLQEDEGEGWEGGVLRTLGIEWENKGPDGSGYYLRGFIRSDVEPWYSDEGALRFDAEEAWGLTDFYMVLEKAFPDIKVYWTVEECGEDIFATNDREGKYFFDRFYADTCINGNYQMDYFMYKSSMFKWLYEITGGEINTEEKVKEFNEKHEELGDDDKNFIIIHECTVMD